MERQKSLRQLAKELEISLAYLSMILSGQRKCPLELEGKIHTQNVHKTVNKTASESASQIESREFESRLPLQNFFSTSLFLFDNTCYTVKIKI